MQNFFASIRKPGIKSPAQTSGRELDGEVRMLVDGASTQVIDYYCYTNDGNLSIRVKVYDPTTGDTLFSKKIVVEVEK